jgi:hypothetical protein
LTGIDKVDVPMELNPYDSRHWPFFGSVLDYLEQRKPGGAPTPEMPRNLSLPFRFSSRCAEFKRGGPYGGFLGRAYDPVCTEFEGDASSTVLRWRGESDQAVADPYSGIEPEGRLLLSNAANLGPDMTLDRLDRRRSLLAQLDDSRRQFERSADTCGMDRFREMAYRLVSSEKIRGALDLSKEPLDRRERYGMNLFGQATLAGRRLLEAGATLVTVFWDEIQTANSAWDTHFSHFERLETELLPGLDHALASLVLDLEDRGMLDDTLVLCLTEHGRTPKLSQTIRGAGRDHWSNTYCGVLAGGGISRGKVIGASDKQGAYVQQDPISPKDVLATMYHVMGIDHRMTIPDRFNRPFPLVSEGEVVHPMLG